MMTAGRSVFLKSQFAGRFQALLRVCPAETQYGQGWGMTLFFYFPQEGIFVVGMAQKQV